MNFRTLLIGVIGACVGIAGIEAFHRLVPMSPALPQAELQATIRDYIVSHPEVLQEAMAEFEKRQAVADAEKARSAVTNNSEAIFNSPRQVVVGNRQGDVTLVEFFDYNCGYCKQALADLNALMKSDAKLKVVLKEFPVLGPGSVEAAQIAVAVRMQDPTGEKYLVFHQRLLGSRGQADKARALAAARDAGADMVRIEQDLVSDEIKASLAESLKLAEQLGINGTPSYVVGSEVVVGAVGLEALREKIRHARCVVTATC
jgi:protein-disulfide isomerase